MKPEFVAWPSMDPCIFDLDPEGTINFFAWNSVNLFCLCIDDNSEFTNEVSSSLMCACSHFVFW